MFVVLGATGNTGLEVVKRLRANGHAVRGVIRDATKADQLSSLGAEAIAADATDSEGLRKAFAGATSAYVMLPPRTKDPDLIGAGNQMSTAITHAISTSQIKNIVLLSSIGAQLERKTGPIQCLHVFEEKLKALANVNMLFLRPGPFMENFLMLIPLVQSMGFLAGGIDGEIRMAFTATRDIGAAAAAALESQDFTGVVTRELHGERDLSHDEAAAIIGARIGKPKLSYKQFPAFLLEQGMKQMGIPGKTAALMTEMSEAVNEGLLQPQEKRSNTSTTPTSLEAWAEEVFAPAYLRRAAGA